MNNQSISLKSSFFFVMESTILVSIGVTEAGLTGFRFNTIGVSDGISMGTDGMSYSLQSRDVIADSIETIMGGQVTFSFIFNVNYAQSNKQLIFIINSPVVRRLSSYPRLRQKHAWLLDCYGSLEPSCNHGLRRNDKSRVHGEVPPGEDPRPDSAHLIRRQTLN
jgi:hypothetical protein